MDYNQCSFYKKIHLFFKSKAFWMLHLNDHLYSKSRVFLWVANFRGLTAGFTSLNDHLHLNHHLYSKSCVFLWVANFRGLTAGFASLHTLSWAFIVGHICITKNNGAFTGRGIYPYLLLPDTYFILMYKTVQPC